MAQKVQRLGEERGGREAGGGRSNSKAYQSVQGVRGGLTLINLERTHFLNGYHSKVVGFIYFSENPLKMMNVPYFI